jgi:hypothetical protein
MPLRNSLVSCLLGAVAAAFALGIPMWGQQAPAPITGGGVQIAGLPGDWSHLAFFDPGAEQDAVRNSSYDRLPILITQTIDEGRLVTLRGNTRPEANYKSDRGPVPDDFPMEYMLLQLKRAPELQIEFDKYADSLTDKSSPNYHQWLTPAEQGERYGLAQEDLDTITDWLTSHGFTVDHVYPSHVVIAFSGTAVQIREAFHTEIHYLEVNGVQHVASMSDPQIPQALAAAVLGVVSMHNFEPHPMIRRRPDYTFSGCSTSTLPTFPGTCYYLVPADFQVIYNLNPLLRLGINGTGQTIAVVEDSDLYSASDVTTYRTTFLSKYSGTFSTIHPGSGCSAPGVNADDSEAELDAEVVGISAPDATIQVATCANTTSTFGGLIAIENLPSYSTKPNIISMSYGECEAVNGATANAAYSSAFATAVTAGISVFVSTGDAGSSACSQNFQYGYFGVGVSGFATTPHNVAVGGTDFMDTYNTTHGSPNNIPLSTYWNSSNTTTDGSAKSYIPEIPWNESCGSWLISNYEGSVPYGSSGFCNTTTYTAYDTTAAGAGGPSGCATGAPASEDYTPYSAFTGAWVSGTCLGAPKPSFQSGIFGNPADGVRDIPDVSLFASSGVWGHAVPICYSDTANGGTACTGAPSTWSAFGGTSIAAPLMAGIQALVNQKWGNQGNPVSTYYTIANAEFGSGGNSACYSIKQPPPRGLGTACAFYDVTVGDNDSGCQTVTGFNSPCYTPSGTTGVVATSTISTIVSTSGGSSYSGTPTCTIAAPSNLNKYLSPSGATIWGPGTQATCTATVAATSTLASATANANTGNAPGAGQQMTVGATTYTWVTGAPTAPYQIEIPSPTLTETTIAKNFQAAVNATSSQCGSPTSGCFGTGTVANASATATRTTAFVTVTAKVIGCNGVAFSQNPLNYNSVPFALSSSTGYLTGGSVSGQICSYTIVNAGQGYVGNPNCTVSGTGGSGATCAAIVSVSTAPAAYQPAYGATPGWDFATGIGSVNAYNLVFNSAW